jgi:hypothetical protein
VSATAGTDPGRIQGVPLTSGVQDEHNRIHRRPVIDPAAMAPQRMRVRGMDREQGFHSLPQVVGNSPAIIFGN